MIIATGTNRRLLTYKDILKSILKALVRLAQRRALTEQIMRTVYIFHEQQD